VLTSQIDLVTFTPDHLDGAVRLSREAGWPHRREDWAFALGLSAGFAAVEDGRLAGTVMMTPYGDELAAINLVIVERALRGRGLGRRLMRAALDAAGERVCRLTATPEGVPLYEQLGFRKTGVIAQHQGVLGDVPLPLGPEWAGPQAEREVAALDRKAFGADRSALIRALFAEARFASIRRAGSAPYAARRPFGRGEVAGPVIAASAADARALLQFLFAQRPGVFMRVDTPADSGLGEWLAQLGLARVDDGIVMERGARRHDPAAHKIYALASQALG
jgi:GNAT superfamily N-acetyltransferase